MIIKIDVLEEEIAKRLEAAYDPKELDLEFVDLHYLKNVTLEGCAELIKQTVTFRGKLTSRVEQICARCLEHIQSDLSAPFDLSYDTKGRETVDTTNDLRDILILVHPDRFLCGADCHGICPSCGANLNREPCRCENTRRAQLQD